MEELKSELDQDIIRKDLTDDFNLSSELTDTYKEEELKEFLNQTPDVK